MPELYDLRADPQETINLIARESHQSLIAKLRAELDQRIQATHPDGKDNMPIDQGIKGELPDEKIR